MSRKNNNIFTSTISRISRQWFGTSTVLTLAYLFFGIGLVMVHVRAESSSSSLSGGGDDDDDKVSSMNPWKRMISGPSHWTTMDQVLFAALMMLALEILKLICGITGEWVAGAKPRIPVRGKHLDDFGPTDRLFIGLSKAQTGPFVYLMLRYCFYEPNLQWRMHDASIRTILLPLPVMFIIYDFFYTILHWFLHIKAVYPLIHKHHHHQKAPSRATDDAVNVHPIEYTLGEYNHMFALFLCCRYLHVKVHILGVLAFLAIGGILAGWNHTRFDITWTLPGGLLTIYDSKVHDVHHRIPQSNYGQYTMFWDYVFGTYRPYDPADRVNPRAQLDPKTGKSLEYSSHALKSQ